MLLHLNQQLPIFRDLFENILFFFQLSLDFQPKPQTIPRLLTNSQIFYLAFPITKIFNSSTN